MRDLIVIVIGLVALYGGGELLVRAAVEIGRRVGLSSLVTGLTIVAAGTSAPELAVSVDAALVGSAGIAIGNILGSNFANIALVLALSAVLRPIDIERGVLRRDLPVMMLAFMAMGFLILHGAHMSAWEGAILLLALVVYVWHVIRVSRRQLGNDARDDDPADAPPPGPLLILCMLVAGVGLLSLGGHWLVDGAVNIADRLGVSEALIGMTVAAVGTSLPEVTASLISILRGHGSMAVGNVVGSNIWNTLGVLGVTAVVAPLPQGDISIAMLGVMFGAGAVLWVFCLTSRQINRVEGVVLLVGYLVCQGLLFT